MTKGLIGVLVMSYGTPESMDQVKDYYTHIRRGKPPTDEELQQLLQRYEAIAGGFFPLRENTNEQVRELETALNASDTTVEFKCYQGLKHAKPYIEDGIQQMANDGIEHAVAIVLAPHYSVMSIGSYMSRAKAAAEAAGVKLQTVLSYHLQPLFIDALVERVQHALTSFEIKDQVRVLYTAHSLPEKILEMNDPYPTQLKETAQVISDRCEVTNWQMAWQSAGKTAMPWLGPDILEEMKRLHDENVNEIVVAPIGFVSDHLEVLYDIDIECQQLASKLGMKLVRTQSLNSDPRFIQALVQTVRNELERTE